MLVRSVIGHEIEQQLQAPAMHRREQVVEVVERPEQRIDVGVIGDVVAEVGHGRRKDRRQPDRIDAQLRQVRKPADDTLQVADAVAIAVLKRTRINLVDDRGLPPRQTADRRVGWHL
jgi:hypothetical protein